MAVVSDGQTIRIPADDGSAGGGAAPAIARPCLNVTASRPSETIHLFNASQRRVRMVARTPKVPYLQLDAWAMRPMSPTPIIGAMPAAFGLQPVPFIPC